MTKPRLPLWPSHAHRWVECPGQPYVNAVALQSPAAESQYAVNGKLAHAILASGLTAVPVDSYLDDGMNEKYPAAEWRSWLPEDELTAVQDSTHKINEYAGLIGAKILCEQTLKLKFPYSGGVHHMNLKVDVLLVNDYSVVVIDYKHGAGTKVNLEYNHQLRLYALAAREEYPGRVISAGILQPRGVGDGLALARLKDDDLDAWHDVYSTAVKDAYEAPRYCRGPWCQMCVGNQGFCPAQLEAMILTAYAEKQGVEHGLPWWVLDNFEDHKRYLKGIDEYSYEWLKAGKPILGWGLESRPGRRKWVEPDEVPEVLAAELGGEVDDYRVLTPRPISITDATRIAKKKGKKIDGLIETPTTIKRVRTVIPEMNDDFADALSGIVED